MGVLEKFRELGLLGNPPGGQIIPFPTSARDFTAKSVACIVSNERSFVGMQRALEVLGFEVACSSSMSATFESVLDDHNDWAMVIVRLDQSIDEEAMESYVRKLRLKDAQTPVIVVSEKGKSPLAAGAPTLIADLAVREPSSVLELSEIINRATDACRVWGSSFEHFQRFNS